MPDTLGIVETPFVAYAWTIAAWLDKGVYSDKRENMGQSKPHISTLFMSSTPSTPKPVNGLAW